MAAVRRINCLEMLRNFNIFKTVGTLKTDYSKYSTAASPLPATPKGRLRKHRPTESTDFSRYMQIYPEFLPDPDPKYRHPLREKLERKDMVARRKVMDIPEFYVGSILAVTISDIHAPGKTNRFVGICIEKRGAGLRANFTLRNVIDHQGVEVNYDLYDPTIQQIQCLRLEKRLDDKLYYLRDAPEEYSTFPFDMEAELLPEGAKVPLNELVVPLKPPPYLMKWEQKNLKGISNLQIGYKTRIRMEKNMKPWEKYDLMKIYRETIPEEEQLEIFREVHKDLDQCEKDRRKNIRSTILARSKKTT